MDLLSQEEKELIKFFERKVQNESSEHSNTNRQYQGNEEQQQMQKNNNRNQVPHQKYSQMFGSSSEMIQQGYDQNQNRMNKGVKQYKFDDFHNEYEQYRQYDNPQRSLNPVIFNELSSSDFCKIGDNNISNDDSIKENNSQIYHTNISNSSTLAKRNQNNFDRIAQIQQNKQPLQQQYLMQQQKSNSNSLYLEQGQARSEVIQQGSIRNYSNNQQQQQQLSHDMNGFTFKPPAYQVIQMPKEQKVKSKKEHSEKSLEKNMKSNSKKDLSNKKVKKQNDQSMTSRNNNNNNSDKKSAKKQNTSRPASSRYPQKEIKNNSFIIQNSKQNQNFSTVIPPNKSSSKIKQNQCNNSHIASQKELVPKQKAKKDESGMKNNSSIYKSGNKNSNLKKVRSSSLYISNNNNSSIIQKDVSQDKLESVRKRSNSKSKRKISVPSAQSNNQLKTDRSKVSMSTQMKRAQSREEIKENGKTPSRTQQTLILFERYIIKESKKQIDKYSENSYKCLNKIKKRAMNQCQRLLKIIQTTVKNLKRRLSIQFKNRSITINIKVLLEKIRAWKKLRVKGRTLYYNVIYHQSTKQPSKHSLLSTQIKLLFILHTDIINQLICS